MTKDSLPKIDIGWEPHQDGIQLDLGSNIGPFSLNLITVRELRDDMEEAHFLARGMEKVFIMAEEVQPQDRIVFAGSTYTVQDRLRERDFVTVLQFQDIDLEIIMPSDESVLVWRTIE